MVELEPSYFHRATAAHLLALYDQRYPRSDDRADFHLDLMRVYQTYGQTDLAEAEGKRILARFPESPLRLEVAFQVAELEAQHHEDGQMAALYDGLLAELAGKLKGSPLGKIARPGAPRSSVETEENAHSEDSAGSAGPEADASAAAGSHLREALTLPVDAPASRDAAAAYSEVLDRYVGVLVSAKKLPEALALLRRKLDRLPVPLLIHADNMQLRPGGQQHGIPSRV